MRLYSHIEKISALQIYLSYTQLSFENIYYIISYLLFYYEELLNRPNEKIQIILAHSVYRRIYFDSCKCFSLSDWLE